MHHDRTHASPHRFDRGLLWAFDGCGRGFRVVDDWEICRMKTSAAGLKAIMQREGVRLGAYRDSRGLLTIGCGHLTNDYFRVSPGMVISQQKAMDLLAHDLGQVEATINAVLPNVALQQYQFDALASLGFNIGCGGLSHSSVAHFCRQRQFVQAGDAFLMWVHPPELRGRRESERRQFLGA